MSLKNLDKFAKLYKKVSSTNNQLSNDFLENFVKMPENDGALVARILPPESGNIEDVFCATRLHNINDKRNIHCLRELDFGDFMWRKSGDVDCPICEYYSWLWKQAKKQTDKDAAKVFEDEARSIKPIDRFYLNVIIRSQAGQFRDNKPNKLNTPLILSAGKQLFAIILSAFYGNEETMTPVLGDVTCPETGRDLRIVKKNKKGSDGKMYPFYDLSTFEAPSRLGTAEQVKLWTSSLHDLKNLRQLSAVEDLKREIRIFRGLEEEKSTGFNPSEYGIEVAESASKKQSQHVSSHKATDHQLDGGSFTETNVGMVDDDMPVPDEEFMQSIS